MKNIYILTCVNSEADVVSVTAHNTEAEAYVTMKKCYFEDLSYIDDDYKNNRDLMDTSCLGEREATVGYGYLDEFYKYSITMVRVED